MNTSASDKQYEALKAAFPNARVIQNADGQFEVYQDFNSTKNGPILVIFHVNGASVVPHKGNQVWEWHKDAKFISEAQFWEDKIDYMERRDNNVRIATNTTRGSDKYISVHEVLQHLFGKDEEVQIVFELERYNKLTQ